MAAAMAVAGKTACGEVGESARRKAERRSVDRDSVKLNSETFSAIDKGVPLDNVSGFHCLETHIHNWWAVGFVIPPPNGLGPRKRVHAT